MQNNISPSSEVKNHGIIFDSENPFDNHIASVYLACYYHLRDLRSVDTAILVANALVSSRLDYCKEGFHTLIWLRMFLVLP